mmetsp:Transcript_9053/g.20387  ORF Transcript_9053/g.20387 Transcript_9053/m.20387 type:complete len:247 (-) Transcript_9053:364-1104(-)
MVGDFVFEEVRAPLGRREAVAVQQQFHHARGRAHAQVLHRGARVQSGVGLASPLRGLGLPHAPAVARAHGLIHGDEVERVALRHQAARLLARQRRRDLDLGGWVVLAEFLEEHGDHLAHRPLVVDNQNAEQPARLEDHLASRALVFPRRERLVLVGQNVLLRRQLHEGRDDEAGSRAPASALHLGPHFRTQGGGDFDRLWGRAGRPPPAAVKRGGAAAHSVRVLRPRGPHGRKGVLPGFCLSVRLG